MTTQRQKARDGKLYFNRKSDQQLYRIDETVDGEYMVVVNGFQWGGRYDASGAGDAVFLTIKDAREVYENAQ